MTSTLILTLSNLLLKLTSSISKSQCPGMYRTFRLLSIQQTYSSTLCTHINNIYNKLSELQKHIQHHCMYPHQTDTVQIDTPEYDLDIDRDNQPNTDNRRITVSVQGMLNTSQESSVLEDNNSTAPDNITTPPKPARNQLA